MSKHCHSGGKLQIQGGLFIIIIFPKFTTYFWLSVFLFKAGHYSLTFTVKLNEHIRHMPLLVETCSNVGRNVHIKDDIS